MRFYSLLLVLFTASAYAEPRAVCDLARVQKDPAHRAYDFMRHHVVDLPLEFKNIDDSRAQAQLKIKFKSAPALEVTLKIDETIEQGELKWKTSVETRRKKTGKLIGKGWIKDEDYGLRHLFKWSGAQYFLTCGLFDRFQGQVTEETLSLKGKRRTQFLGGDPKLRKFGEETDDADVYDIGHYIYNQPGIQGDLVRKLFKEVIAQGYQPFFGNWSVGGGVEILAGDQCDSRTQYGQTCERHKLTYLFRELRGMREHQRNTAIKVIYEMFRDERTGSILDLRIQKIQLSFWLGGLEGNANTSGGRIIP